MAMAFPRISSLMRRFSSKGDTRRVRRARVARAVTEVLEDRRMLSTTFQVDVRLAPGQSSVVDHVGQVVNMQLWGVVTGSNATGTDDGLCWVYGSIFSKGAGILGNLQVTSNLAPFNATGASRGALADLDGDGDQDVGSNQDTNSATNNFFLAEGPLNGAMGTSGSGPQQFHLADLQFTVTNISGSGQTDITFRVRRTGQDYGAAWIVDGVHKSETANSAELGAGNVVHLGPDLTPPAAQLKTTGTFSIGGNPTYTINVAYSDYTGVKYSTLNSNDIVVTGPRGTYAATFAGATVATDAKSNVAAYTISARDGYWNYLDNGTYTVTLKANQISDTLGNYFTSNFTLGTFKVAIPYSPANFTSGTLSVMGTAGNDVMYVYKSGTNICAKVNGVVQSFASAGVLAVRIYGMAGNDLIWVGPGVMGVWADGGPGNDTIFGGDGNDTLYGGDGNDIIVGGAGNDAISGGAGRNILIGGTGGDAIDGTQGEDIMVSGSTSYDANTVALTAIMAEWSSGRTYCQRVTNIRDGSGTAQRLNGNYFLHVDQTVFADTSADLLRGGAGLDWFMWKKSGPGTDVAQGVTPNVYTEGLTVVK